MSKGFTGCFAVALTCGALLMTTLTATASAGQWAQVSCRNPDGSASTNQGWSSSSSAAEVGSNADTNCGPGAPMTAYLSSDAGAPVGASELLTYTPPAGSSLAGGTISISGTASGADSAGTGASGTSVVYTPQFAYNGSNVIYQCASGLTTCQNGDYGYSTEWTLPSNEGGDLFLQAGCGGAAGYTCNTDAQNGTWSQISLAWADLLLSNTSAPTGSNFSGTLLSPNATGTASLLFSAADPSGPGVYTVTVAIDGSAVYAGTPDSNGGECVAHGTYPGTSALEFDYAQPCPQTENVDVPVNTTGLSTGTHELTVSVTDAAGNTSTVLDQDITTVAPAAPQASLTVSPTQRVLSKSCVTKLVNVKVKVKGKKTKKVKKVKRRVCTSTTTPGKAGTARVRPGHRGHAYGLLLSPAGSPVADAAIVVTKQIPGHGTHTLADVTTNASGEFSLKLTGPDSTYHFSYAGGAGSATAAQKVTATTSTTFALPKRIYAPSSFSAHGAVKGGYIPRKGVAVSLYYRVVGYGNDWRSFGPRIRTDKRGRWHARVPVPAGARGYTYQFRARVKAQKGWPYAGATSAIVSRRIR